MTNTEPFISAHPDPEGESPWGMQIVVEDTKNFTPLELAYATTKAVMGYLHDESLSESQRASIDRWMQGRIRKVVRRAKNTAWSKTLELSGNSFLEGNAKVHVLDPSAIDNLPDVVRKAQVSGLQTVPNKISFIEDDDFMLTIYLNRSLNMSAPKAAVAAAHTAQIMANKLRDEDYDKWKASGFALKITSLYELVSPFVEFMSVVINDGGLTEVAPGSVTAVGLWKE